MLLVKKFNFLVLALVLTFNSRVALSVPPAFNQNEMHEVLVLAKRIHKLQPNLDEGKYLEYATGIYRASTKYGIEADILLAITKQETSFREDLPEGAAGELGICQIRKMWVAHPDFKREFPKSKAKDLLRPAKSFLFAAWILRDLKDKEKRGSIPYWSYYNARRFEPRLRYYTAVSRHLADLNQNDNNTYVEEAPKFNPGPSASNERKYVPDWSPEPIHYTNIASVETAHWSPEPIRLVSKLKGKRKPASEESSWIASALKKLQEKKKKNKMSELSDGAIYQAASDLNVMKSFSPNRIVRD